MLAGSELGLGRGPTALAVPVQIEAAGKAIDIEDGHADPYVCDWNADGLPDLLVGLFGGGRLLFFPNVGTAKKPKLGEPETFQAGGSDGTVPSG
ncbi:MAG: hypothetical protein ACYS99_12440 [Planctomycetota bacterium]